MLPLDVFVLLVSNASNSLSNIHSALYSGMLVNIKQGKRSVRNSEIKTQNYFEIPRIVEHTFADQSWFHERGIIVSNDTMFAMHEVHSVSGQDRGYHYLEVSSAVIETFAVDANSDTIYFMDSKSNTLVKLDIISQQIRTLVPVLTGKG